MNKKGNMALVIGVLMTMIAGMIGLTIMDSMLNKMTTAQAVTGETWTGLRDTEVLTANPNIVANATVVLTNSSSSPLVEGTHYIINSITTGAISAIHENATGALDLAYNYYDSSYTTDATLKTILDNIAVLFGVGLLIVAVGWFAMR